MKQRLFTSRVLFCVALLASPIYVIALLAGFTRLPPELAAASAGYEQSARFVDRDGRLLREMRAGDMARASWISLDEAGPNVPRAILAAEDQRFELHAGVDPIAVVRAAIGDLRARKITSGASTLTMQLARLVRPHRRSFLGKLEEAALAVKIESALTKDQILAEYINRAPFGPNLRGIDAASRFYFDKPPRELSLAEAATLAAIPRGPELYALDKHADRALRRRDRILGRMHDARVIDDDAFERAKSEPLFVQKHVPTFGAPHLVEALSRGDLDPSLGALRLGLIRTTIQSDLQGEAEQAALVAIRPLQSKHVTAASVVVIDNATGDVLAYVGSPDYFDAKNGGQNDGVRARRQPGSTLKPFVYGLAMERLDFTAATPLPDIALELPLLTGAYEPMNYDERFHGPVRLREALANSFNVPAVWTATRLGSAPLLDRLHDLGMGSLSEAPDYYGPALALGDGEVTLLELTNAYATLARRGVWKPTRFTAKLPTDPESSDRRVMPATVANILADILKDKNARLASFGERSVLELPFEVAAKTGTSKGFRDNWTVGFTREITVGVWVGNFDGSAMDGVSGISGAGPIFRSVMQAAMCGRAAQPLGAEDDTDLERVEVCPLSGERPTEACPHRILELLPRNRPERQTCTMHEFVRIDTGTGLRADGCQGPGIVQRRFETFPSEYGSWARAAHRDLAPEQSSPRCDRGGRIAKGGVLQIASPNDGAAYVLDPSRPFSLQALSVRIDAPSDVSRVRLRVDGRIVASSDGSHVVRWLLSPGAHVLVAEAGENTTSAPVCVTVQ